MIAIKTARQAESADVVQLVQSSVANMELNDGGQPNDFAVVSNSGVYSHDDTTVVLGIANRDDSIEVTSDGNHVNMNGWRYQLDTAEPETLILFANGGSNQISGSERDDIIVGGNGDDHIAAGTGNDKVFSGPGNDVINPGIGDDLANGCDGDDRIGLPEYKPSFNFFGIANIRIGTGSSDDGDDVLQSIRTQRRSGRRNSTAPPDHACEFFRFRILDR